MVGLLQVWYRVFVPVLQLRPGAEVPCRVIQRLPAGNHQRLWKRFVAHCLYGYHSSGRSANVWQFDSCQWNL